MLNAGSPRQEQKTFALGLCVVLAYRSDWPWRGMDTPDVTENDCRQGFAPLSTCDGCFSRDCQQTKKISISFTVLLVDQTDMSSQTPPVCACKPNVGDSVMTGQRSFSAVRRVNIAERFYPVGPRALQGWTLNCRQAFFLAHHTSPWCQRVSLPTGWTQSRYRGEDRR